jgi:hypothetical protein
MSERCCLSACCARPIGVSRKRIFGEVWKSRSSGQNKTLHRAWRSLLVGVSHSCSRPHLEGGGPRELPHVALAHTLLFPLFRAFRELCSLSPKEIPVDPLDRPLASVCELMASANSASGLCQPIRSLPPHPRCTIPGCYHRWALVDWNQESAAESVVCLLPPPGPRAVREVFGSVSEG